MGATTSEHATPRRRASPADDRHDREPDTPGDDQAEVDDRLLVAVPPLLLRLRIDAATQPLPGGTPASPPCSPSAEHSERGTHRKPRECDRKFHGRKYLASRWPNIARG